MQQTPCDFIGYLANGRVLMIEAKMVRKTSLAIADRGNGLQIHQWNELHDCARAGGLALVCWARGGFCATIEISMAAELSRDRRSIPWDKIEKRFLRSMTGTDCHLRLLDHWLPIIRT